jgi:uncharacterized protein with HEPN domain
MRADERDNAYLWDMREAARDCEDFIENATYDEFCANPNDAFRSGAAS